jgi:hypothetical protein
MKNISIYALANYLANSVFKHYKRKNKWELEKAIRNINTFKKVHSGFFIKNSHGIKCLNSKKMDAVSEALKEKVKLIQEDWSQEALSLTCIHANILTNTKTVNILLDFRIRNGHYDMLFGCKIANDGVIDYFIEDYGDNHNEYYEKYKNALGHFTLPD